MTIEFKYTDDFVREHGTSNEPIFGTHFSDQIIKELDKIGHQISEVLIAHKEVDDLGLPMGYGFTFILNEKQTGRVWYLNVYISNAFTVGDADKLATFARRQYDEMIKLEQDEQGALF